MLPVLLETLMDLEAQGQKSVKETRRQGERERELERERARESESERE